MSGEQKAAELGRMIQVLSLQLQSSSAQQPDEAQPSPSAAASESAPAQQPSPAARLQRAVSRNEQATWSSFAKKPALFDVLLTRDASHQLFALDRKGRLEALKVLRTLAAGLRPAEYTHALPLPPLAQQPDMRDPAVFGALFPLPAPTSNASDSKQQPPSAEPPSQQQSPLHERGLIVWEQAVEFSARQSGWTEVIKVWGVEPHAWLPASSAATAGSGAAATAATAGAAAAAAGAAESATAAAAAKESKAEAGGAAADSKSDSKLESKTDSKPAAACATEARGQAESSSNSSSVADDALQSRAQASVQRLLNFLHDAHRVGRTSTIRKRLREQVRAMVGRCDLVSAAILHWLLLLPLLPPHTLRFPDATSACCMLLW
jgi:hypothetical protein